ncbi:hypothetical protein G6F70_008545 [Rhizopus microsporus]|uniref:Uncharacterized protein n=2 Tax=Rhizopus TaxID=4842 RepID=A0A367IZP0_RHIAZ|nr:hypothetical protein G6F71_008511 [Rhizopus microsporus]RCH83156.1 hypothetical protein CU097_004293 [Rhizopus azygosporus]KAG1195034.1 hypothetical protein G6F70_008545 [Rhizopus microsporus]KAG1206880.1 hypothetical protein G6F69_008494 [Rhizopus microsporus]KAG1227462.1 hypothetical protein G6F67_008435 [Rhizopus microsporus]
MSVPMYSPNSQSISPSLQPGLYEYLSELVSKRVATIKYIRKAHEGNTHWFNTILLTKENLQSMYPNSKMAKRTYNFYALGLSLGAILDITNPLDYIKALNQIMLEFERHTNDDSKQKMKNIFRKKADHSDNASDYGYLILPHIPFEMDYFETFFTLVDIVAEAYYKLLVGTEGPICTQAFFELVLKCDGKFKKIVSMVTKELDIIAREAIKDELRMIDPFSQATQSSFPIEFDTNGDA